MRCSVCGKTKWGQVLVNGVCKECLSKPGPVAQRNPRTGVVPNWSVVALSGSFPTLTTGSVLAFGQANPQVKEDTMEEQLHRVDILAPLSREQREAAKRAIRRAWGDEE